MIDKQKIKELHIKRNVILLAIIAVLLFILKIVILYMLGIKDSMLRAYINFLISMGLYIFWIWLAICVVRNSIYYYKTG
ncbi:MAG: hypothetical protein IIV45_08500, partial [Lachnospiraceae bacterium]|nr:hypothetical protein [Lachnospiraceae bacterium]